jgi:hypothetical protein
MLVGVAVALPQWPIVGRRSELEVFERALGSGKRAGLGGPVEAGAGRELCEVTRGNPLYVRELVLGALDSGALVERSGVWHLEGQLPATSRLLDLVEQRIGGLSAEARSVVELLAWCEPWISVTWRPPPPRRCWTRWNGPRW